LISVFIAILESNKGIDGLSGEFIVYANDSGFGD
jgi:hypothetical protein